MQRDQVIIGTLFASAILTLGGCADRPPTGITCEGVRALKPEMKEADVERLIGPPTFGGPIMSGSPKQEWHYEEPRFLAGTDLRFVVRFENDTVTDITLYFKPWWSSYLKDIRDIYKVSADRRFEDPEFRKLFHCE